MGKPGKTTTQISMQAYGGMQTEMRRMTKEDKDRYATPGTEAHSRHLARVKAMEKRRDYREKAIKDFDREEPVFGSFKGLTKEDVEQITATRQAWVAKRKEFMKELDKTYPAIKY
jgi:hypothetical protein